MAKFSHTHTIRFGAARNELHIEGLTLQLPPVNGMRHPIEMDRKEARRFLTEVAKIVCEQVGIKERNKPQRRAA